MTPVVLVYFLCAVFVVVIYVRLYSLSLENGTGFRIFVELVHPVMQVAMFISVLGVAGPLGQFLGTLGALVFAIAAVPFLLNTLFVLWKRSGKWTPKFLKWFDLGESITDSVIHAVLCVGMSHMFFPHQTQSEWLNNMLTMLYVMFFGIYLLKFVEEQVLRRQEFMGILSYLALGGKDSKPKHVEPNWLNTMRIVAHLIMIGSMILMQLWVHTPPNIHIH